MFQARVEKNRRDVLVSSRNPDETGDSCENWNVREDAMRVRGFPVVEASGTVPALLHQTLLFKQ